MTLFPALLALALVAGDDPIVVRVPIDASGQVEDAAELAENAREGGGRHSSKSTRRRRSPSGDSRIGGEGRADQCLLWPGGRDRGRRR